MNHTVKEYRVNTTAYLSIKQLDELDEIAKDKKVSRNFCIDRAVTEYINANKKEI